MTRLLLFQQVYPVEAELTRPHVLDPAGEAQPRGPRADIDKAMAGFVRSLPGVWNKKDPHRAWQGPEAAAAGGAAAAEVRF